MIDFHCPSSCVSWSSSGYSQGIGRIYIELLQGRIKGRYLYLAESNPVPLMYPLVCEVALMLIMADWVSWFVNHTLLM